VFKKKERSYTLTVVFLQKFCCAVVLKYHVSSSFVGSVVFVGWKLRLDYEFLKLHVEEFGLNFVVCTLP
jgi:hypothetical protein